MIERTESAVMRKYVNHQVNDKQDPGRDFILNTSAFRNGSIARQIGGSLGIKLLNRTEGIERGVREWKLEGSRKQAGKGERELESDPPGGRDDDSEDLSDIPSPPVFMSSPVQRVATSIGGPSLLRHQL
jgi:hypothetical protein